MCKALIPLVSVIRIFYIPATPAVAVGLDACAGLQAQLQFGVFADRIAVIQVHNRVVSVSIQLIAVVLSAAADRKVEVCVLTPLVLGVADFVLQAVVFFGEFALVI